MTDWLTYTHVAGPLSAHAFVPGEARSVCGKVARDRCAKQLAAHRCRQCVYSLSLRPGAHWLTAPIAEVDAELRRLGLDPAEVGAEGERVAREALVKRRDRT